jgi:hypothetical protein
MLRRCIGIVRNGPRTGQQCHLLAVDGYDVCEYHTAQCEVLKAYALAGGRGVTARCGKPVVPGTDKCFLHTERTYAAKGTSTWR